MNQGCGGLEISTTQMGYCGNVHPSRTIDDVKHNLAHYSLDVKSQVHPDEPMGIGLWLSATAASELDDRNRLLAFRDWLAEHDLVPFTLNGFPFGDFHQEIVKHDVYLPTWDDPRRLDYTLRLAEILNVILPPGIDGSISTLPLGWPVNQRGSLVDDELFWKACSRNLQSCAIRLDQIAQSSGRNISVCIEPEPGCILGTYQDVLNFFDSSLFASDAVTQQAVEQHIGVCHDICHSAVMFESQSEALAAYQAAGIRVGKVQVSSAVEVNFEAGAADANAEKLEQLRGFAEPRYLHQTSVRNGGESWFFEDLGEALEALGSADSVAGKWRVHFHVPIFSEQLDLIDTTQSEIDLCLEALRASGQPLPHLEVETYAWNVLPARLQEQSLADGIAKELKWFEAKIFPK